MQKAVLISINPKWCGLISSGKKTLEVRKTRPKLETSFKCYIYCTNDRKQQFWAGKRYSYADERSHNAFDVCGNGKVIGEFVCDDIECKSIPYPAFQSELDRRYTEQSCVPYLALHGYCYHKPGYFWHISGLVIYCTPRKISAFSLKRPPQSWCYVEELD